MAIETLDGGVAYRKEDGSIFILGKMLNYPLRFADITDVTLTQRGSLFSFGRVELDTIRDVTSGVSGGSISTAYLADIEVIPPSEYVGSVQMEPDGLKGYITLTNYDDIKMAFEAQDLSTELQKQNMEGKLVSFQKIRFTDHRVYATNIQICTTPVSARNSSLLARVDEFYAEENLLYLDIFFNEKVMSAVYDVSENPNFQENQIITVKADIKYNHATVKELHSIVDRRKGLLKEFKDATKRWACIIDESNAAIGFWFNIADVEPSSLTKLAGGKTVSYNLKCENSKLIPYNIRIEN
ncbi:hypothetical protein [Runella sp.]|uniref:hypothetical protein n=1 Tax=Runella sp. TaxID=1960881 RepID=UPI003D09DFD4